MGSLVDIAILTWRKKRGEWGSFFLELCFLHYWWGWEGLWHSAGELFPHQGTNYKATLPFDNDAKGLN
jgi:hypothetical protein